MSKEENAPMDANAPEVSGVGRVSTNTARNVYAMDTLIAEVLDLFPETTYETSDVDGRNAAHDVQFTLEGPDQGHLLELLELTHDDDRVIEINYEEGVILVSFTHNARLKDTRDPFNLSTAFDVLIEDLKDGSL